jgi:hypothetical protein
MMHPDHHDMLMRAMLAGGAVVAVLMSKQLGVKIWRLSSWTLF